MVKERKKKYVRIRLDRGWVTAVTKKGEVLMEKVVPEEDIEAARHHMKKKKKKHKKKKKGEKKGEEGAPRETEWGEGPAPEASAGEPTASAATSRSELVLRVAAFVTVERLSAAQ